ncbi:MAG TPA: hypothetical protein HPP83_06155 [Candidatus Hydrogenedentes bacterium]|nr:hypothetical protein [Candidatus Hydrogenedentota bacterium]
MAPFFEWRIFHPRSPAGGGFFDYTREDFAAIRRRGGNTALMMHDWMGEKSLYRFVPSEVFPDAIDPEELERNRAALRRYIEWAKDYGLRVALWICEMPCQGGPWMSEEARAAFLERYPEEVLSDTGTYQGKVVCLGHPRVEEYYRELMRGLLTDFPEVALIQLFTLDSNAEFCSPEACPRHQGVSKIEQRDRLIRLILEEGRKVQPDFRVLTTTWGWQNHPEFLERQAALPAGSGLFSTPDGEAWSFDRKLTDYLVRQRDLCRDRGQMFLGYDIFLWGDDVLFPPYERIYDFPFGIAAKLRRWAHVRADGVFDQWGTEPDLLACNSMALRAFLFDPFQEPEPVLERIAERQFGAAAAPHVLDAWRAIEAAQQVQSDHTYYWHALRHGWSGGIIKIPPTIEALAPLDGIYSREPHKPAGPIDHAPGDDIERARQLGAAMRDVVAHFDAAVVATERALKALEPDHRSFYADLLTDAAPVSPREHLERQLRTLRLCSGLQRELGHFFEAFAIVKDMNGADQETRENLRVKHQALMRETLEGTRALRQLLDEIGVGDSDMAACLDERAAGLEPAVSKDLDPKDAK